MWGSPVEVERRNRILVSVYAYAYEIESDSIISDGEFDDLAMSIQPEMDTGNALMDKWFKKQFDFCTGSWIHAHPELNKIKQRAVLSAVWKKDNRNPVLRHCLKLLLNEEMN